MIGEKPSCSPAGLYLVNGGEGGIRTHGAHKAQRFSRPPDSTALAPLQVVVYKECSVLLGCMSMGTNLESVSN